jgi:hypothetical protein
MSEEPTIVDLDVPDTVEPGARTEMTITAENHGYQPTSNPFAPDDHCVPPDFSLGVNVDLVGKVGGAVVGEKKRCLSSAEDSRSRKSRTYGFDAPELEGSTRVEAVLRGHGTGTIYDRETATIEIESGTSGTPSEPDDSTGDQDDGSDDSTSGIQFPWPSGGDGGGGGSSGPFASINQGIQALIILLILFAIGYVLSQVVQGASIAQDVTGAGGGG